VLNGWIGYGHGELWASEAYGFETPLSNGKTPETVSHHAGFPAATVEICVKPP
jgi:hypothetical protein